MGLIALNRGDLDGSEEYLRQSLAISTELGHKEITANQLANLGYVAQARGDCSEACRLWREALGLFKKIGMPHLVERVQVQMDEAGCPEERG